LTDSLCGGRVVVTGAATGVGRALAREAALRDAGDVALVDLDSCTVTQELIAASGGLARAFRGDVSDLAEMQAIEREVAGEDGRVNVVCANAGKGGGGTVDTISSGEFEEILRVNVLGVFNTVKVFLPGLRRARVAGQMAALMITGSEHSVGVPPYVAPMTACTTSKFALLGLAAALRRDLIPDRIHVSILCPSYVRTERLMGHAVSQPSVAQQLDSYGQDSESVARLAFDAIESGVFVIPTNPSSRDFIHDFHREILDSLRGVA
jgi:NAD(P)-dependent dehydrogenase (short-subunit alcohol dehydrogenase family)